MISGFHAKEKAAAASGNTRSSVLVFTQYLRPEDDRNLDGQAFFRKCPRCSLYFDVRSISESFKVEVVGRRVKFQFFMCPACVKEGSSLKLFDLRAICDLARLNVELASDPNEWAVATDLAVLSHGGDDVAAIIYGCRLSDQTIESYDRGEINLAVLVPSMTGESCVSQ